MTLPWRPSFFSSTFFTLENAVGVMEAKVFDNGDEPYKEWLENNPEGYVLNTERSPDASYARFHQPDCSHISGWSSQYRSDPYTGDYRIKVCADEPEPLIEWLMECRPKSVAIAKSCRSCEPSVEGIGLHQLPEEETEPETHEEGSAASVEVNRYERSEAARQACLEHYGAECEVCGLRFEERYGEIGEGFIEVHHEVPLSETDGDVEVDPIDDLKPVCPNCHAMLHRESPPLAVDDLKERLHPEG